VGAYKMFKYNIVVISNNKGQKGAASARYLQHKYPHNIIISSSVSDDCDRNIIRTQIDSFYTKRYVDKLISAIHFYRPNIKMIFRNTATNGFSVFKQHNNKYRFYIPMMQEYVNHKCPEEVTIGYYNTSYRDTKHRFLSFLNDNNTLIKNICIMGDRIDNINSMFNIKYTTDRDIFFSSITHLVVPMSATFIDPWPTVMEEAVRCNKQIIVLSANRNWQDGIDDICSCIKYHTKLDLDVYYDNTNCSINRFDLDRYYNMLLFENNFEYNIDVNKYMTFNEWAEEFC
jgi:hypothetical protein